LFARLPSSHEVLLRLPLITEPSNDATTHAQRSAAHELSF
jgi:hypothetical protein